MASCKGCLFYNERLSEFVAMHQDSTPENEKPKEHFCQIFLNGIPDAVWNGTKKCERRFSEDQE